MLRKLAAFLCLLPSVALAQIAGLPPGIFDNSAARAPGAGAAYSGPLDILAATANTACYSLRACSAAYGSGSNNGMTIYRQADGTTLALKILSNKSLDIPSALTFATVRTTCTGTISGTTLAVTSCSGASALQQNYTFTGTGITQPAYITALGTCASPPGTCTINQSQTVSVAESITFNDALYVSVWNDQSGNGNNIVPANSAPFTPNIQLLPYCLNSGTLPCLNFVGAAPQYFQQVTTSSFGAPETYSFVGNRTCAVTSFGFPIAQYTGGSTTDMSWRNAANTVGLEGGGTIITTSSATDNAWHAYQGAIVSSGTSTLNLDGTETTGNLGTISASTKLQVGAGDNSLNPMCGRLAEAILVGGTAASSTQRSQLHVSASSYFGTP